MAPSPTGYFHIGSVRTTLYNWLFAKKNKGVFVLRIEDTDKERNRKEFEEDILKNLDILDLKPDEMYRQSERTDFYTNHLKKLIEEDKAYYCFCTKEELEKERKVMEEKGMAPKYGGKCASIDKKEAEKRVESGEAYVIRLRVPEGKIAFKDMIRGEVEFDAGLMGDVIIARNLEEPLYNFSVVIDDILMKISHVIRGEEHLPNTPKQLVIYNALNANPPLFAHLPLLLNKDRSKMSKRYGDVAVKDYLERGYLPEALINFVALLGWHPQGNQEIFSREELINEFDIERVQKAGAVFDIEKLNWINRQYIVNLPEQALTEKIKEHIPEEWKINPAMVRAIKPRLDKIGDAKELLVVYFELPEYEKELLFWKGEDRNTKSILEKLAAGINDIEDGKFDLENVTEKITALVPDDKKGDYLWPLRVSLSGSKTSPTPFELLAGLGKEESLRRIRIAIGKLNE
ncbi:MAG TPA: glutamate--tRNA ligase [Candidatus Colwellbacteria bacterium]|nr:glutamate--tRNA ligase [Candidatus Colwellbacteria bacterium]